MNTLQIRIDNETKRKTQKILSKMGLDMSTAVKLYFHQIIERQAVPFTIVTENGLTLEQEKQILDAAEESKKGKHVSKAMKVNEAIAYLKKK